MREHPDLADWGRLPPTFEFTLAEVARSTSTGQGRNEDVIAGGRSRIEPTPAGETQRIEP